MKNGSNGGHRQRKKAGSFAPTQPIDKYHNDSTPCCALTEQIVKECFPEAAALVKQPTSSQEADESKKNGMEKEQKESPPSLLGSMIRSYLLEQRLNKQPQPNSIDTGTKRKRKRKKKKANKATNNGETPPSEAATTTETATASDEAGAATLTETATASISPATDTTPPSTEQTKSSKEEREKAAAVIPDTTEANPKPTQLHLLLDRILQNGHMTPSSVTNRHLSSFVSFLTERFQRQHQNQQQHGGNKSKRKTKAAAAAPSQLLPTIQIKDVSAACEAIGCRVCRTSAEAYLRSTCITGGVIHRVGDWSSGPSSSLSADSIILRPSTVTIPKNAARKKTLDLPIMGRSGFGGEYNDDLDIEGAFDYVAMEEGGVNESDAMSAADAHFCIALRPTFDSDGRKQSLQIRAQLGENGGPRYPIGVQDIEYLVRHMLLPCGLKEIDVDQVPSEEECKLTAKEFSAIQKRVEKNEEKMSRKIVEDASMLQSVQERFDRAIQSTATTFDVKSPGELRKCEDELNMLLRRFLGLLLSVTEVYHSIVARGGEQHWAKDNIDKLWDKYDETVAAMVEGASRHDGRLIQLASRPGAVPQMFLNASHRSSFRDLLNEKLKLLSDLRCTFGDVLSRNEANAYCPPWERIPTFSRSLHTYDAFYATVEKRDSAVDRRQLDESCAALLRAYCELTENVRCTNVSDIWCAQEARCERLNGLLLDVDKHIMDDYSSIPENVLMNKSVTWRKLRKQYGELVEQARLEENSSGEDISEEVQSGSLLRLRQTLELLTSNVLNQWRYLRSRPLDFDADSARRAHQMPLQLRKWMAFDLESNANHGSEENKANACQGGYGKRRIACVLTGLLYRWLCDRCMEWHAELTQDELLDAMDEKLVLDYADTNDSVASTSRAGKSGKKHKKKKDRKIVVASVRESAPEIIPASTRLEPTQRGEGVLDDRSNESNEIARPRGQAIVNKASAPSIRTETRDPLSTEDHLDNRTGASTSVGETAPDELDAGRSASPGGDGAPNGGRTTAVVKKKPATEAGTKEAGAEEGLIENSELNDLLTHVGVSDRSAFQSAETYLVARLAAVLCGKKSSRCVKNVE